MGNIAQVRISPELIAGWLYTGTEIHAKCIEGLPADAKFVDVMLDTDYIRQTLVLFFEHETFTGDGQEILPVFQNAPPARSMG